MEAHGIWHDIQKIKTDSPLIHNITNYVVMNNTANALLAVGASPIMAHAKEEVEEIASFSNALVINIGTLSNLWIESMIIAGKTAKQKNIPIVLDPVGAGATKYRNSAVLKIIEEVKPTVIRGNASEIKSIANSDSKGKGVDSIHGTDEIIDDAIHVAKKYDCIVSVSGKDDVIVSGNSIAKVSNGHAIMSRVTGMGCTSSAITGAFLAVNNKYFYASIHAMVTMGIAGEIAAEGSNGPGSFQVNFIDALYNLDEKSIENRKKINF